MQAVETIESSLAGFDIGESIFQFLLLFFRVLVDFIVIIQLCLVPSGVLDV